MITRTQIYVVACCALLGFATYAYFSEWIVIHVTKRGDILTREEKKSLLTKKTIKYYYPQHDRLISEEFDLMWRDDTPTENFEHLLQQYLITLHEEQITDDKVTILNAFLSPTGEELYLSFDKKILPQQAAIHTKLLVLKGILQTLHDTGTSAQQVYFLHNHQPMTDAHIDLEEPWPLDFPG